MIRTMLLIVGVVSTAVVCFETAAVGVLWYQGQIGRGTIQDIRSAVFDDRTDVLNVEDEPEVVEPSSSDIARDRSLRILQLNYREGELSRLEQWLDEKASKLTRDQQVFEQSVTVFDKRLKELNETIASQAITEARGILLAMTPVDAVEMLMEADLQQNILLVKGMPEKKISGILTEFLSEETERTPQEHLARQKRAHDIFELISSGDPHQRLIEDVQRQAAAESAERQ